MIYGVTNFLFDFFEWVVKKLSIIKDLVTIVTLSIGSYVALQGLKTWKKQLVGSDEYKLAKAILLNSYKYQVAMEQLRNPAVWTHEYPLFTQDEQKAMNRKEKAYRELVYAYQKRWEKVVEVKPLLFEAIFESRVVWGNQLKDIFQKIFKLEYEVRDAISDYLAKKNPDKDLSTEDSSQIKSRGKLVFDSCDENDVFRTEIDSLIMQVANILKPKLKS